ncbi:MAG: hypothetical protein AB8F78_19865 [Saprospiraceae bacterium]
MDVAISIDNAQEAFLDDISLEFPDPSDEADEAYLNAVADMEDQLLTPVLMILEGHDFESFYSKIAPHKAELDQDDESNISGLSGLDVFAYNLFLSDGFYSVMNENYEILVGGEVYNMLSMAIGQTEDIDAPPVQQSGPLDCWEWNSTGVNKYFDNSKRRLKMRNSHFIVGSFVVMKGRVKNSRRKNGRWRGKRARLQVGFEGEARWNGTCFKVDEVKSTSKIKKKNSIETTHVRFRPSGSAKKNESWSAIATNYDTGDVGIYVY